MYIYIYTCTNTHIHTYIRIAHSDTACRRQTATFNTYNQYMGIKYIWGFLNGFQQLICTSFLFTTGSPSERFLYILHVVVHTYMHTYVHTYILASGTLFRPLTRIVSIVCVHVCICVCIFVAKT